MATTGWLLDPESARCSTSREWAVTDGGERLSLDAVLELLANIQRRAILSRLHDESDHAVSLQDLVTHLVRLEADQIGEQPGYDHIEAIILHVHLPKLADAGVVEYDAQSEQLRYWPNERLEHWLALVEENQTKQG